MCVCVCVSFRLQASMMLCLGYVEGKIASVYYVIPQVPKPLGTLPSSFQLSESAYGCLLCYIQDIFFVRGRTWEE